MVQELYTDDVVAEPVQYENGYLLVPPADRPGLGVTLNEAKLEKLRAPLSWGHLPANSVLDRTTVDAHSQGEGSPAS